MQQPTKFDFDDATSKTFSFLEAEFGFTSSDTRELVKDNYYTKIFIKGDVRLEIDYEVREGDIDIRFYLHGNEESEMGIRLTSYLRKNKRITDRYLRRDVSDSPLERRLLAWADMLKEQAPELIS